MTPTDTPDPFEETGISRRGMYLFIAVMMLALFAGGLIGFLRRRAATSPETPTGPGTR